MLIDRGAQSFPDENRYNHSLDAVEALYQKDIRSFSKSLSVTSGRPGDATLRLIPAACQILIKKTYGISPFNPVSLMIPQAFNVIVSVLILIFFYKITLLLFENNHFIAFICALVYSLLPNSNVYIRHMLPYDSSFLCFILAFYYILKSSNDKKQIPFRTFIISGALAGFGFVVYPAYYFMTVFILALIIFTGYNGRFSVTLLIKCLVFAFSAALVFSFYEMIARLGGTSYFSSLKYLSTTVTQGSFEEGFTVLPKYLIEVEGPIGVFLLFFASLYLIKSVLGILSKRTISPQSTLRFMVLTIFVGFLIHASSSAIFHKMVFYGRIIHIYFPFLIWASVSMISSFKKTAITRICYGTLIIASAYSFIAFSLEYIPLAYPFDVLYKQGIREEHISPAYDNMVSEIKKKCIIYPPPPPFNHQSVYPVTKRDLILVNFCYYFPLGGDFSLYNPPREYRLIYSGRHFLSFPAYGFEGFSIKERRFLRERDYKVSIYEK
jgi:hypothetical protein